VKLEIESTPDGVQEIRMLTNRYTAPARKWIARDGRGHEIHFWVCLIGIPGHVGDGPPLDPIFLRELQELGGEVVS
jgi:hypothetical protein